MFTCKKCKKRIEYGYNNHKYNFYYKRGTEWTEREVLCYDCYVDNNKPKQREGENNDNSEKSQR